MEKSFFVDCKPRISKDRQSIYDLLSIRKHKANYFFVDSPDSDMNNLTASEVIEMILLQIPLQNIYCIENSVGERFPLTNRTYVKAVDDFYNNRFSLTNVQKHLNGLFYKDLSPLSQSIFEDFIFNFVVFQPPYNKEQLSFLFKKLGVNDISFIYEKL